MPTLGSAPFGAGGDGMEGGRRRKGVPVKTLKKMLKKAGLKTTGRKAALTRRAKKAHLKMRGAGGETTEEEMENPLSALPKSPAPETIGFSNESPETPAASGKLPDRSGGRHRRRSSRKH